MAEKYRITIVEDHPFMREGLAQWFENTGRWLVTGTASSLAGTKELLEKKDFQTDILLLDIQLEDGWGLNIISMFTGREQKIPIIAVYTAYDDFAHVSAALSMGVKAYICKRRTELELEEALIKTLNGGICIDDTARTKMQAVTDIAHLLTRREKEILNMVKSGLTNNQIASDLGLSRRTIENVLSCVYDKTGIRSRRELERL